MEKEGCVRAMEFIENQGLEVGLFLSDRHIQISKWMREEMPETVHKYDVWHIARSFQKKVDKLGKQKDCESAQQWGRSMTNHLYWSVMSSEDDNSLPVKEKWLSLINHLHNKHKGHGTIFKKCQHGRVKKKKWLKHNTKVSEKLTDIISNKRLCNDIIMASNTNQTSLLEAYHSFINHFAPKHTAFSFCGMISRLRLAALHYNKNSAKDITRTKTGQDCYSISFPKYKKGQHTVRSIKQKSTYGYMEEVAFEVFEQTSRPPVACLTQPPPLASQFNYGSLCNVE
uniref:MULE transposase domain-containing protein n=1 Tax=Amphimedon queenslandica TaxID=400682 RepID=A0A1X7ST94_AMPQE